MATPHPALDAAVQQFAQQPGVSPADVSALRAALSADPNVSQRLDTQAASGALHGFALAAADAPDRPVGNYDRTAGTMTLPSSAFSGPHPDVGAVLRVQAMVAEFGGKTYADNAGASHPVTPDMLNNLQATLNKSPALAEEIKRAATTTDPLQPSHRILESFAFTKPGDGVGGSFNAPNHAMNLVSESLITRGAHSVGSYNPHDLTFVIGHEVQHGFNAEAAEHARRAFVAEVHAKAATPGPVHDYTALVEQHIQSGRDDEAGAQIAGWNALRSRVQHDQGSVRLTDLYNALPARTADFIEPHGAGFIPHANVQLNPDLSMPHTPVNVTGMGHNYFDRPTAAHLQPGDTRNPMGLGHGRAEDYPNYYAGWAVAVIGAEERAAVHPHGVTPQVQINMAHAGLYEDMMEKAGLNLAPSKQSVPYLDSSTQPAVPHRFDHTADGPNQFQHVPVAPNRLDNPSHPDHAFYQQARGHVVALDKSLGRTPDVHTDQLASAAAVQARADGLHRIDQVALSTDGQRLWSVQTPPGRTDHLFDLRTSVPTAEAMTPMEQSGAQWPQAMKQFEQAQQQQTQSQQVSQTQAQAQGPVMSHGGLGK
ncbi:XVIPCD domain-containing protein [Luteibacter sp. ME-Dv--P-043b]|uniref:XVIPCD domain-containing protein n=1 Tax=Luteibacter sp. ME-Dv--P-043b TaxID=3040291 RepID=UPI0025524436|nr:XVIPCD domain-containing protein [Luteibacter sp. ME-Dv--P-043b]